MAKYKIEIKWAFIFIIASLLWLVVAKIFGMFEERIDKFPMFSMLFILPAVIIYMIALKEKREIFYNGQMNFKQGFIAGLIITVIVTLFTPLSQFVFHTYIAPEFFPNIIRYSVANEEMTQEEAEKFFNMKSYIMQSFIASLISGILTSLVVAYFVKSKTPEVN